MFPFYLLNSGEHVDALLQGLYQRIRMCSSCLITGLTVQHTHPWTGYILLVATFTIERNWLRYHQWWEPTTCPLDESTGQGRSITYNYYVTCDQRSLNKKDLFSTGVGRKQINKTTINLLTYYNYDLYIIFSYMFCIYYLILSLFMNILLPLSLIHIWRCRRRG